MKIKFYFIAVICAYIHSFAALETGMWGIYNLDLNKIEVVQKSFRSHNLSKVSPTFDQLLQEAKRPDDDTIRKNIFFHLLSLSFQEGGFRKTGTYLKSNKSSTWSEINAELASYLKAHYGADAETRYAQTIKTINDNLQQIRQIETERLSSYKIGYIKAFVNAMMHLELQERLDEGTHHMGGQIDLTQKFQGLDSTERMDALKIMRESGFLIPCYPRNLYYPDNFSSFNTDFPYTGSLGLWSAQFAHPQANKLVLGCGRFIQRVLADLTGCLDANANSCDQVHDLETITVNVDMSQNPDVWGNLHQIWDLNVENRFDAIMDETGWCISLYDKNYLSTLKSIFKALRPNGKFIVTGFYESDPAFIEHYKSMEIFILQMKELGFSQISVLPDQVFLTK